MADWKYQNRRDFLKYLAGAAALLQSGDLLSGSKNLFSKGITKLTVLYTNDQHSRIEPFPSNDAKYPNEGGFARRASVIEKIRAEEDHVLLLDAGDIFQGTPYFNYFSGEVEYKLMSMMRYDAITFGNHDFDLGCANIAKQMPHATFDFINCNYDLSNTELAGNKKIFPYKIYRKGGLKIGVFGLGIELENLVDKKYVKDVVYNEPVIASRKWAKILKQDERCDLVICLSHLGYKYSDKKISDVALAAQSSDIDLIIGGHTHTFMENPDMIINSEGKTTYITQAGWAGIWLGKAEFFFSSSNKKMMQSNMHHKI